MGTICETCGDKGFNVALVYCDKCQTYAIHRYCLPKLPKTFDENVVWFCADCKPDAQRQISLTLQLPGNLEKDERQRTTSLASGGPSSTNEDRLTETESPSSNTCTHSTGSDRVNVNEGTEICKFCEPKEKRQSSPLFQLPENLDIDETRRTSLAVGGQSSNSEDRLVETETSPSKTSKHSMESDWFNINGRDESVNNRSSLVAINDHLKIIDNILDSGWRELDKVCSDQAVVCVYTKTSTVATSKQRVCSDEADSRALVEKDTVNSNKKISSSTISAMCIAAEEMTTNSCLQEVLPNPSPPQKANPSEEWGKCGSENQPPHTVVFQGEGGDFSVEGQDEGVRPCTTEGVGSQSISADGKFSKLVQGYLVKPSLVSTLDAIIKKHGDIAQDCQASGVLLTRALEGVCEAIKDLEALPLNKLSTSFLSSLNSTISEAELLKLNVTWFREKYDELKETFYGILQYKKLKVDIKEYCAMIKSEQKTIELERSKLVELQSRIQSREMEVASMVAKADEMDKAKRSIKSKFRKFHRKSLVDGLI